MLKEFLNIDFNIEFEDNEFLGKVIVFKIGESNIEKLSSGYQAIIRLFLELLYFEKSMEQDTKDAVIDEINEYLSTKNEDKILPFLQNRFSNMRFIITTHSADVIASSIDCTIIVLNNDTYECLDENDFTSATDVREIFEKIYNLSDDNDIKDIEIILRNLLNAKISETWTDVEEEHLNKIDESILSNSQKLILRKIKSW